MALRSREFLGVKLVPFGGRKRVLQAALIVTRFESRTYGVTPTGAVAVTGRRIFRPAFDSDFSLQEEVALDLSSLGVLPGKVVRDFLAELPARREKTNRVKIAGQIAGNLQQIFGVKLTRAQQRAIDKLTK